MGDVVELFGHRAADAKLFTGMDILVARIASGRLYLGIVVRGSFPPEWAKALSVAVRDPLAGKATHARLDSIVRKKDTHYAVRTTSIAEALLTLTPVTTIEITSPSGQRLQRRLRKLLEA
jgi:hypothetical protein